MKVQLVVVAFFHCLWHFDFMDTWKYCGLDQLRSLASFDPVRLNTCLRTFTRWTSIVFEASPPGINVFFIDPVWHKSHDCHTIGPFICCSIVCNPEASVWHTCEGTPCFILGVYATEITTPVKTWVVNSHRLSVHRSINSPRL